MYSLKDRILAAVMGSAVLIGFFADTIFGPHILGVPSARVGLVLILIAIILFALLKAKHFSD